MTMTTPSDLVELTRRLVRTDTINPPGAERVLALHLAELLADAGARTRLHPFAEGRCGLIAEFGGRDDALPLCFTGHLDTVPLGASPWTKDPFAGELSAGRLYGRGSTDMKGGLAAFVVAALRLAPRLRATAGVRLILTAAEETGCEGARHMVATSEPLGPAGALIVGEPTANVPLTGHKGSLWLRAIAEGVTAHASMPHLGVNAVCRAARAVTRLDDFSFQSDAHPALGAPTLNVGFFHGGANINSVPDRAEFGIDVRTLPGEDHAALLARFAAFLGEAITVEPIVDVPGMWTEPSHPWLGEVFAVVASVTGSPPATAGRGAPYVTDASVLTPALGGVPTVILGPGDPELAHQTDESCRIDRLEQAAAIYEELITRWCRV